MMTFAKFCSIAAFSLFLTDVFAATGHPIVPHEAEYRVKISLLRGELRTRVEEFGSGYRAESVISPTGFASILKNGSITELSEFVLTPEGIRPRHYESVDTLSKEEPNMNFDFDWPAGKISGSINGTPVNYEIDGEVQDRVSIQYELMHQLLHGEAINHYQMLDGDEIKELDVKNIGVRKVDVPFGEFDAVGIQHRAGTSSRVTTLWCVRELGYLPVIIEQHRNGKLKVRAVLTDYQAIVTEYAESNAEPIAQ